MFFDSERQKLLKLWAASPDGVVRYHEKVADEGERQPAPTDDVIDGRMLAKEVVVGVVRDDDATFHGRELKNEPGKRRRHDLKTQINIS